MKHDLWLLSHGLSMAERRSERVRRYGEIRMAEEVSYEGWELVEDLLGLLLFIGFMVLLLFLAGGL